MFTPTVYAPEVELKKSEIQLSDPKFHHIKNVLRIRENSGINISNGKGHIMYGKLKKNYVVIEKIKKFQKTNDVKIFAPFLQDKNRFRYLIEKLVELNVSELYIGETRNTQKTKINNKKIDSWVISALEQSGSPFYPNIIYPHFLDFEIFDTCFDISGQKITENNKKITNFAIGPEGGWSKDELKNFKFKFKITDFNLRSETAAITALSLIM